MIRWNPENPGRPQGEERNGLQSPIYQAVSDRVIGAYFGMACENRRNGITNISDLELGVDGIGDGPPFGMMNKVGIKSHLNW